MHFGAYPIWEYQEVVMSEAYPKERCHFSHYGWPPKSVKLSSKAQTYPRGIWASVVQDYSRCFLTKPSDKLVAIAGIANALQAGSEQEYFAGLWRKTFLADLLWKAEKLLEGYDESTVRPDDEYIGTFPNKYHK
jgi:hypothetical protein